MNGRARVNRDPDTLSRFAVDGRAPRLIIVVSIEVAYFQCSRAVVRSDLLNSAKHLVPSTLPRAGQILGDNRAGPIDGAAFDPELPGRVNATRY